MSARHQGQRILYALRLSIGFIAAFVPRVVSAAGNPFERASQYFRDTRSQAGAGDVGLETIIGKVIQGALSLAGVVFVILAVYAGYRWMTAEGDSDKITKAKDTLTAAIIGLAITLAAYAISIFVITKITVAAG